MNNLYRELAPVTDAAWASIEAEARRTFELHVAARRVNRPDQRGCERHEPAAALSDAAN